MNFDGDFIEIGVADPAKLADLVGAIGEHDWELDIPGRGRVPATADLRSVALVFDPDLRHSHPTRLPLLKVFESELRSALELVADHFENGEKGQALVQQFGLGYFIRATFERLRAAGSVEFGPDQGFSLVHSHRLHVPLVTSEAASFTVGSATRHLEPGRVYEINNRRSRAEHNAGDIDRIHLVLDFVMRGERCCCGVTRHPNTFCSPRACRETDQLEIPCRCFD